MIRLLRRRGASLPAFLVLAAILAALVAACAPPPALTDPREILARAVGQVAAAKSLHYLGTVGGELPLPSVGSQVAAPVDLAGTTLEGRVDLAGQRADATLTIPGLGPLVSAVVVGPDLYLRVALLGPGYQRQTAAGSPFALLADPVELTSGISRLLEALPAPPVLEGTADCGGARCYRITTELSAGSALDLGALLGGLLGGGMGGFGGGGAGPGAIGDLLSGAFGDLSSGAFGDLTAGSIEALGGSGIPGFGALPGSSGPSRVEVLVRVDDLRPQSIVLRPISGEGPTLTLVLDQWDAPVSIETPPG